MGLGCGRLGRCLALTVAGVAVGVLHAQSAAAGTGEDERASLHAVAQARVSAGLPAYRAASDLVAVAARHAAAMAASHRIYHNPRLADEVRDWQAVGENVGMGGTVEAIHDALMRSPPHRANILDRDFTEIGVGAARDGDGVVYVTQVFRLPATRPTPRPSARRPAPRRPAVQPARSPRPTSAPEQPATRGGRLASPTESADRRGTTARRVPSPTTAPTPSDTTIRRQTTAVGHQAPYDRAPVRLGSAAILAATGLLLLSAPRRARRWPAVRPP